MTTQAATYDLPSPSGPAAATPTAAKSTFPEPVMAENALWLCKLRWVAIAILVTYGVSGLFVGEIGPLGLLLRSDWPLIMGGLLVAANLLFEWHARRLVRSGAQQGARLNIWSQMALDLVAHTFAVHFLGTLETYVLFIYLFHIVLSCIFFSRRQSLVVAVFACVLFALCFGLEAAGIVAPASVHAEAGRGGYADRLSWASVLNVASAMVIWLVVWYMASYLSDLVRERGTELAETNRRLVEAQEEKTRHLLRTTHELKAPFAAIHANTQLLLKGHCGALGGDAHEVVLRIAARCRRLAREIQEMLQLANLRSRSESAQPWVELDLEEVIGTTVAQIKPMAEQRGVAIEERLEPARVRFVEEHLKMLLANLLSNAVTYSHEGGLVRVDCTREPDGSPRITIEDRGIGIPQDKLPRIFDEYYRTEEAARFNKESTGLGLTIVRHIAEMHSVRLRVESRPGEGTKFVIRLSPRGRPGQPPNEGREETDGLSNGR